MKSSSCFFSFFSCIHLLFCRSAVTSVAMPPTHRAIPSTSVILTPGTAANAPAGTELSAMTGMQMREHHVAWAIHAPKNLGGEFLISSKRESEPCCITRWRR